MKHQYQVLVFHDYALFERSAQVDGRGFAVILGNGTALPGNAVP